MKKNSKVIQPFYSFFFLLLDFLLSFKFSVHIFFFLHGFAYRHGKRCSIAYIRRVMLRSQAREKKRNIEQKKKLWGTELRLDKNTHDGMECFIKILPGILE